MPRLKGRRSNSILAAAIKDYMAGDPVKLIAQRFEVSQPTITYWAKKFGSRFGGPGFVLRSQGLRPDKEPTERNRQILEMADLYSQVHIAKLFGLSRERISTIISTWKERGLPIPCRFHVGDTWCFGDGNVATIARVDAYDRGAIILDIVDPFHWKLFGHDAKKLKLSALTPAKAA